MSVAILRKEDVTEKQHILVESLVSGLSMDAAAQAAGYSNAAVAAQALRSKTVALLLQQMMASRLQSGAPVMFAVLKEIATNKAAPAGARVDAAKAWLDRAGFQVPRQAERANDGKALHEMTAEELKRTVLELRAQEAQDVTPKPDDPDGLFD